MEELTSKCDNLSLSVREGKSIILSNKHQESKFVLAAKFYTRRALNIEAVARTFRPLWRTRDRFHISNAGNNILLFDFEMEVDAEKVLLGEPWSYDRHLVSVQRFDDRKAIKDIDFKFCAFWIQIHDIPYKFMTKETAKEIGDTIGPVIKQSEDSEWKGGTFLRVRVKVDTTRPLCRGRKVTFEEGQTQWVSFQYEKLPNVCYWCGRLLHDDKECEVWIKSKGTLSVDQQQFGNWIRANSFGPNKSRSLEVKGFESRQTSAQEARMGNKDREVKQRNQTSEVGDSSGGEVERMETATEEDEIFPETNLVAGFRGKSENRNKETVFEASGTESGKAASPTQPLSNPRKPDSMQQTKDNFLGLDSQEDPTVIRESLVSNPKVQISQGENRQNRGLVSLGSGSEEATIDLQKKGAKEEKGFTIKSGDGAGPGPSSKGNPNKISSETQGISDFGPGPVGEVKKGLWTRLKNRPNPEMREEFMHGTEALKRKAGELEGSEEFSAEKMKKQRKEGETKKQGEVRAMNLRSAEVVEQPHRSQ
ncbi:uncharacterized protein LOC126692427 [Quercus robur]|uniref:uncharacterized protein LOC126692427 n=1 Tax=Quercus robur TaxID=38942 RepID=UPI0021610E45|nr:uncharacterized protein LOC126692427 [Quercus robur]